MQSALNVSMQIYNQVQVWGSILNIKLTSFKQMQIVETNL